MDNERRREREGTAAAHTILNVEVFITDHLLRARRYCSPSRKPSREITPRDYRIIVKFCKKFHSANSIFLQR